MVATKVSNTGSELVAAAWQKTIQKYSEGNIIVGEVVGISDIGVWVELPTGLEGFVDRDELPISDDDVISDRLWRGDIVEAHIKQFDLRSRRVRLSISTYLDEIETFKKSQREKDLQQTSQSECAPKEQLPMIGFAQENVDHLVTRSDAEEDTFLAQRNIRDILVVDDMEDFRIAFVDWLRARGFSTEGVHAGSSAIELASTNRYDLIFMDFHLFDMDGVTAAVEILKQCPHTKLVIIRGQGWQTSECQFEQLSRFPGYLGILNKPLDLTDVRRVISGAESGQRTLMGAQSIQESDSFAERITYSSKDIELTITELLSDRLESLRKATRAVIGMIFEMDPISRQITVAASSFGPGQSNPFSSDESRLQELRHSPVKDVIREKERIWDNAVFLSQGKFKHLLMLMLFEACIGVPIEVPGHETRYGMFLFDRQIGVFSPEDMQKARATGTQIGLALRTKLLEANVQQLQALAFRGQFSSALVHELGNQLGTIGALTENLELYHKRLQQPDDGIGHSHAMTEMHQAILHLSATRRNLAEMFDAYLGLGRDHNRVTLDVKRSLNRAQRIVSPIARDNRVIIKNTGHGNIPKTLANPRNLEQVFANIMLNAIHHTTGVQRPAGYLVVDVFHDRTDKQRPIKIRFIDDGPGIHRRNFDRIFELGFSTRKGGSGIGLAISRQLVEEIGGKLTLEKSIMFVGSSFLIELPAADTTSPEGTS